MTKIMTELYTQINEQITISSAHQEKLRALAIAKMAILTELEQQTEKDMAALKLGMELGSLGA